MQKVLGLGLIPFLYGFPFDRNTMQMIGISSSQDTQCQQKKEEENSCYYFIGIQITNTSYKKDTRYHNSTSF